MVLTKGLIRVGIGVPASADFELVAVDDPYHFASAAELSLFRRPLPTTNLQFLSTVMWDGRETFGGTDHCNIAAEAASASRRSTSILQTNRTARLRARAGSESDLERAARGHRGLRDRARHGAGVG